MIPIFSPVPQYETLKSSLDKALLDTIASGNYILGPQVQKFEEEFAAKMGCSYAVGVNSGTDALLLALRALDIGPRDEVITTTFSYVATSEVVVRVGARPVFVDIDPDSFNIDLEKLENAVTEHTRAIIPVHLFGRAVDMTALMRFAEEHNLYVIEDCAQATGAEWNGRPVGSYGHMGCFSFFPTKNLGAMGDGGAITTNDPMLVTRLKSLRVHGSTLLNRYDHQESGINSRLDTIQAALLLVKLPYLESWNMERRETANFYTERILNSDLKRFVTPPEITSRDSEHVFHQYTIKVKSSADGKATRRDQLQESLRKLGVVSMIYYPIPLHLQKTHLNLGYRQGDFPISEELSNQVLSLPIFPGITRKQQELVIEALEKAVLKPVLS